MKLKKKYILIFFIVLVSGFLIFKVTTSFGMQHYYNVDFSTGLVTATNLNVRSGPRHMVQGYCNSKEK